VAEAVEGRREELAAAKEPVEPVRVPAPEDPGDEDREHEAEDQAEHRRHDDEQQRLDPAGEQQGLEAGLRDRGASIAADQRVRRGDRDAVIPGDQVPEDRADEPREDHLLGDHGEVDHSLADRLGDVRAEHEGGDEVEEGGPDHRDLGAQDSRRDDGRDRVRRVVEAIEEVEDQGDQDDGDQDRHRALRCS